MYVCIHVPIRMSFSFTVCLQDSSYACGYVCVYVSLYVYIIVYIYYQFTTFFFFFFLKMIFLWHFGDDNIGYLI